MRARTQVRLRSALGKRKKIRRCIVRPKASRSMVNPLTRFVGKGASLLALGRAAKKANLAAGADTEHGEGAGAATRHCWPLPLLSTREAPPLSEGGWYETVKMPKKRELRAAGHARALENQAQADAPIAHKRAREQEKAAKDAQLLAPLAAADAPGGKRKRSALAAAVLHEAIADDAAEQPVFAPGPMSMDSARRCNDVLRRWREFEEEMTSGNDVLRGIWRIGMQRGYPRRRS